jgi:CheY-specific phosphatase CheX
MSDNSNYQELARRYGFAPKSESASRLTQLVARQDCDVDEIVKVINKDSALRDRLLRVVNPDAENEAEFTIETVEEALLRNGVGCAMVLAMGTPLALALIKTAQTMVSIKLEKIDRNLAEPLESEHLLGTIVFSGQVRGGVYLRTSLTHAGIIAARILGLDPGEMTEVNEIRDVIGELLNIMTGNFKSNLCDAGLDCKLQPPEVRLSTDAHTPVVRGGGLERMAFRTEHVQLLVDVTANPWSGD